MTLEQWLERATRKLSAESATKVRAEIQEHHDAAIERGAASEEAVASLGSAAQANRRYRSVLLTADEQRVLEFWRQPRMNAATIVLLGSALFVALVTSAKGPMPQMEKLTYAASLLAAIGIGWFGFRLQKHQSSGAVKWLLRGIPLLAATAAAAAYSIFGFDVVARFWTSSALITLVTLAASTWPIQTPEGAQAFRPLKWAGLVAGAIILFWHTLERTPWAILLGLWIYAWNEWMRHSLRKKLPVDQWPRELYR